MSRFTPARLRGRKARRARTLVIGSVAWPVAKRCRCRSGPDRAAILASVSDLFDERRVIEATGAEVVDLPYVTHAFRGIRS